MKLQDAKIKVTHHQSFRPNEWATIIGVKVNTPKGLGQRPCYQCLYDDGQVDYIAIEDSMNYEIGVEEENTPEMQKERDALASLNANRARLGLKTIDGIGNHFKSLTEAVRSADNYMKTGTYESEAREKLEEWKSADLKSRHDQDREANRAKAIKFMDDLVSDCKATPYRTLDKGMSFDKDTYVVTIDHSHIKPEPPFCNIKPTDK